MAKIQDYVHLAGTAAAKVTKTYEDWTGFLTTASRLYKYPFAEQLMIYAQRPDATACAEYELWNRRMRRFVKRGSKGIGLVNVRNGRPSLRYVFDVSDTGKTKDSCSLYLWQYKEEHRDVVTKTLEGHFGIPGSNGLADQLECIAAKLAGDYWEDYHGNIMYELEGSQLEGMDEFNVGSEFRVVAGVSIAYTLISRCGLHPEKYFKIEDFQNVCDFNTQRLIKILGVAVSQASEMVLRQIAMAIVSYERKKQAAQQHNNAASSKEDNTETSSAFSASTAPNAKGGSQPLKASVQETYNHYKPVVKEFILKDEAYKNACRNSDRQTAVLEGISAIKRAALSIKDLEFMKFYYDLAEFHEQMQRDVLDETYPMLSAVQEPEPATAEAGQEDDAVCEPESDTAEPERESGSGNELEPAMKEKTDSENSVPGSSEPEPAADGTGNSNPEPVTDTDHTDSEPSNQDSSELEPDTQDSQAADYQVGDTVYLEDTLYKITDIGLFDIQLRDPSLNYPVFRTESKDRFEDMLRRDPRNMKHSMSDTDEPVFMETEVMEDESEVQEVPVPDAQNFRITDEHLGEGGPKAKFRMNMEAITTLKQIESESRAATPDEQEILSRYVGWGGIPDAFEPKKEDWSKEYKELDEALTPEEYASARLSTLNAHYTSPTVIRAIYEAVSSMGFKSGNILEPACGIGNFFGLLPEGMSKSKLYGVELDDISGRIAKLLYPEAQIEINGYEKTDFPRDFFDISIGNVPFVLLPIYSDF